jgi:hypothetical protein
MGSGSIRRGELAASGLEFIESRGLEFIESRAEATPTNLLANGLSSGYPADVRARLASAPDASAGVDTDAAAAEEDGAADAVLEDWAEEEAEEEEAVDAAEGPSALRFCPLIFGLRYSGSDAVICFLPRSARKLAFISASAERVLGQCVLPASCQVMRVTCLAAAQTAAGPRRAFKNPNVCRIQLSLRLWSNASMQQSKSVEIQTGRLSVTQNAFVSPPPPSRSLGHTRGLDRAQNEGKR